MHPFEVMAEPIRRRIVEMLASGEHTAGDIEAIITHEFGVGRSAVQHHLAYFKRVGWVCVRDEWPEKYYRLDPRAIPSLERQVRHLRKRWNRRIGWMDGADPLPPYRGSRVDSKKGLRGRGRDPDDPWRRPHRPGD